MCGIAGIISLDNSALSEADTQSLSRMSHAIRHRGPDDSGIFLNPARTAALAHRRLSIIDPTPEAHQPMESENGNVIIFNGEIYNYKELRSSYGLNVPLSDTAVLLALLEKKGISILKELRGFFSFGYWNEKERELTLARDSIGKKPLYYGTFQNKLIFGSELRALLASEIVPFSISREALRAYLRFYSVPHPLSMIEGVHILPPGSILHASAKGIRIDPWYRLPKHNPLQIDYEEARKETRRILERSVRDRLVSDVPVGAFLSGGLDSNAIVGLASQATSSSIETFSTGFSQRTGTPDETDWARIGAQAFHTQHHEWKIAEQEVAELLPEFFSSMDLPTGDGLNSFLISKAARRANPDLKVVLSVGGGDEAFLGYAKYRWLAKRAYLFRMLWTLPKSIRSALAETLLQRPHSRMQSALRSIAFPEGSRYLFGRNEIERLMKIGWNQEDRDRIETDPLLGLLRDDEEHYLPDMLLRDLDTMTMSQSLEARAPLLDRELLEFTWQLPSSIKAYGTSKQLLADAVSDIIPDALKKKPKTGFELPMNEWLHSTLHERLDLLLSDSLRVIETGLLQKESIRAVHRDFVQGRSHYLKPWTIIVLEEWIRSIESVAQNSTLHKSSIIA